MTTITGTNNNDWIEGTALSETIVGLNGNDWLFGGGGNDAIKAGDGDDFLFGGEGNDVLRGGNGVDSLLGGVGDDFLFGGAGADRFVFQAASAVPEADRIGDFQVNQDKLEWAGVAGATVHSIVEANGHTRITYDHQGVDHTITLVGVAKSSLDALDFNGGWTFDAGVWL